MREFIIVGAGAGGAGAALALRGRDVLMLDVGRPLTPGPASSISATNRVRDIALLEQELIGERFESVADIGERDLSVKLKAPRMRPISERVTPADHEENFCSVQSFTKGGLANAWGAGLMRYTADELGQFPISVRDLDPIFDKLTEHIGISGSASDDLSRYFGSAYSLLPELELSELGQRFVKRYIDNRQMLNNHGVWVGRPRLGVLPVPHRGRPAFKDFGAEFFSPLNQGIYSPAFTIDELVSSSNIAPVSLSNGSAMLEGTLR
jgi:choline dehydrogenase-like flavoprotein